MLMTRLKKGREARPQGVRKHLTPQPQRERYAGNYSRYANVISGKGNGSVSPSIQEFLQRPAPISREQAPRSSGKIAKWSGKWFRAMAIKPRPLCTPLVGSFSVNSPVDTS